MNAAPPITGDTRRLVLDLAMEKTGQELKTEMLYASTLRALLADWGPERWAHLLDFAGLSVRRARYLLALHAMDAGSLLDVANEHHADAVRQSGGQP